MNERIKELAEQAGIDLYGDTGVEATQANLQELAELIVQECKENFAKVWYEQGMDIRGAELDKFMTRFEEHFGVK